MLRFRLGPWVAVLALLSGADYFRLFWREVRGPAPARPADERLASPPILAPGAAVDAAAATAARRDRRA